MGDRPPTLMDQMRTLTPPGHRVTCHSIAEPLGLHPDRVSGMLRSEWQAGRMDRDTATRPYTYWRLPSKEATMGDLPKLPKEAP